MLGGNRDGMLVAHFQPTVTLNCDQDVKVFYLESFVRQTETRRSSLWIVRISEKVEQSLETHQDGNDPRQASRPR